MQIHKTTAFCHIGNTCLYRFTDRSKHFFILTQCFCIQFRISAMKKHSVYIFREFFIMNGRKGNQLRTHFFQKLQIVLIEKAECFILRQSDPYASFCMITGQWFLNRKFLCTFCQFQKSVNIHGSFQDICQFHQFIMQICDFFRHHQTQMTAFQHAVLHHRNIPVHFHRQGFFDDLL